MKFSFTKMNANQGDWPDEKHIFFCFVLLPLELDITGSLILTAGT